MNNLWIKPVNTKREHHWNGNVVQAYANSNGSKPQLGRLFAGLHMVKENADIILECSDRQFAQIAVLLDAVERIVDRRLDKGRRIYDAGLVQFDENTDS